MNLSNNEKLVYFTYAKYANNETGESWPSQYAVAEELDWFYTNSDGELQGDNVRVSRALKLLAQKGLVTVRRRRNQSSIVTLIVPGSKPAEKPAAVRPKPTTPASTSVISNREGTPDDWLFDDDPTAIEFNNPRHSQTLEDFDIEVFESAVQLNIENLLDDLDDTDIDDFTYDVPELLPHTQELAELIAFLTSIESLHIQSASFSTNDDYWQTLPLLA